MRLALLTEVQLQNIFHLEEEARQGDPISAFIFILALEILFILIKAKPEIEGMTMFGYNYLYSAYADDTTFFLKHMVDNFHFFSVLFRIKTKFNKM